MSAQDEGTSNIDSKCDADPLEIVGKVFANKSTHLRAFSAITLSLVQGEIRGLKVDEEPQRANNRY